LNACEAAPEVGGQIEVTAMEKSGTITILIADNGPGIAESIRERLFHPFVSYGKQNGTGLGLAVVQKIVQDHGGEISPERTEDGRTVFKIVLPGRGQDAYHAESGDAARGVAVSSVSPARRADTGDSSISRPGV
jgi:signal transduction histidine kinase